MLGALVATAVAVLVAGGFFWLRSPRATPVGLGDRLPAVELDFAAQDGPKQRLDTLRGHPVLLIFVETRSEGGLAFTRALERLHRRYNRGGLNQVVVALDEERGPLREVLQRHGITYTVLADPGGRATSPAFGRPQPGDTYLVDRNGVVQRVFVSRDDWSDNRVAEAVEEQQKGAP
jgi:peroxiredoxin